MINEVLPATITLTRETEFHTWGMSMNNFNDPFEALFAIQRALDSRRASDWMGSSTSGIGSFPPINIFQRGDDFVAIVEVPGVEKDSLSR
jgi:HSP20 family protein